MSHLAIPEPCHEDWGNMTPEQQGRFCDKCCKVVMDFTTMPTEDVIRFISDRSSEKICGRFRSDQVSPPPVFEKKNFSFTGRMKVFLAALVMVFGTALFTGCGLTGSTRMQEKEQPMGTVAYQPEKPALDSPAPLTGRANYQGQATVRDTTTKKPAVKMGKVKCVTPPPHEPMGAPIVVPDSTQD